MIKVAATAVVVLAAVLGVWLAVQSLARRLTGTSHGDDPLAGRLGCRGCGAEAGRSRGVDETPEPCQRSQ